LFCNRLHSIALCISTQFNNKPRLRNRVRRSAQVFAVSQNPPSFENDGSTRWKLGKPSWRQSVPNGGVRAIAFSAFAKL
jgi:hypothetical protein